jgi:hypothetical protein
VKTATGRSNIFFAAFFLAAIISGAALEGETRKANFEFIDQKYGDILYTLSAWSGISIVADDTVTGKTSFQYAGTAFERAFDAFLIANRLYADKDGSTWTVSKISVRPMEGSLALDASDSTLAQIFDRVSRKTGTAILFDLLPANAITLHIQAANAGELVSLAMKPFGSYAIETEGSTVFIRKKTEQPPSAAKDGRFTLERSGSSYALDVSQSRAGEIIERLCREERIDYSSFMRSDPVVTNLKFSGKSFRDALDIVLEQAGCAAFEESGMLYILPGTEKDAAGKIRERSLEWKTLTTGSIRQKDALALLQARFPDVKLIASPDGKTILARADGDTSLQLDSCIAAIDSTSSEEIIRLKYISTQDLLKAIPPALRKEEIADTGTGNSFFYTGPAELRKTLLAELGEIDKPRTRISYDMLIIQFDDSTDLSWGGSAGARQLEAGDRNAIGGSFENLLSLNFDVVTLFGYRFAGKLSAALAGNKARVFTDTTLHGISGENIKFQNTSTYRYRDSNVDAETGKTIYTGITREIISGITLELNGWVSGEGIVTMAVNAMISKRGADVSSVNGNPPPTSEKSVQTRLSTKNGEPVILSGLSQNDESIVEQRVPLISKIPIIGLLFRNDSKTKSKSEMVIYIVPHISNGPDSKEESARKAATAYGRLVVPFLDKESMH